MLFGLRKCEQSGLSIVHNLPILWCDCPLVSVGATSADPTNGRLRTLKNILCLSRPNTDLSHFSLRSTIKKKGVLTIYVVVDSIDRNNFDTQKLVCRLYTNVLFCTMDDFATHRGSWN